jgi:hypothetical protein
MILEKEYLRENAVLYARKYAFVRNPLFATFEGIGGNCTNFVSQCILAGSCVMNFTPIYGWYFLSLRRRSPSWSGVEFFYNFITQKPEYVQENGGVGPYGVEAPTTMIEPGDVVQLANEQGTYYHTLMITGTEGDDFLVSAHTNDARNRPLSTYNYASARFLHIRGARLLLENEVCYRQLLGGVSYRPLTCAPDGVLLRPGSGSM